MKKLIMLMLGLMLGVTMFSSCSKDEDDDLTNSWGESLTMQQVMDLFEGDGKRTHEKKQDKQAYKLIYTDALKIDGIWIYTNEFIAEFKDGTDPETGNKAKVCTKATASTTYACKEMAEEAYKEYIEDDDDYFHNVKLKGNTVTYEITDYEGMTYDVIAAAFEILDD